jgi:radical SAM protein with 4Fe4S-binding SPASM domain
LLRQDLPEILSFIRSHDIEPVVITNGMLLTPERVSATLVGGNYEITLLSTQPKIHDQLAGCQGAWDATIDGMLTVRRLGGNHAAVFIATQLNYQDLYATAELAIATGASMLMYNRLNLGRYNLQFAPALLPSAWMVQENLDALEEIGGKYKIPISVSVVCEPCVIDIQKYNHIHFGFCPLGGEDSYFTIDPRGNVRICNHSPVILGNILQESFKSIFHENPYLKEFRETLPIECQDCPPDWKNVCRGGCKAAAEQCYGTFQRVDPFVTINRS